MLNLGLTLGLGATSVVGVPAIPSGLELGASSLKTHPGNLTAAGQTSVLKQSATNFTNIMVADDSFLVARVYCDFERMHLNNRFCVMGTGFFGSTAGRFNLVYWPKASSSATNRQRFVFNMRRTSGTQRTVLGGIMPEVSGWYDVWVRRLPTDSFKIDVYDMAGTKVSDGAATALTAADGGMNALNPTHFYIGDAVETASEATTATARTVNGNVDVGWDGAIAFILAGDAAVADADCEAIALGDDAITRLGASNFRFARRFGMDAEGALTGLGPVADTGDTTSAATVIGSFLPGGTPGRQGTTDYITLDPVADYRGFGVDPDTLSATVPFAGSVGGNAYSGTITALLLPDFRYRREVRYFGGQVQGRFCNENGTPVSAWQAVQTISAPGVTNGLTFTENSRSAPAIKVLVNGQSQMTIWSNGSTLGNTITDPVVSIARQERATASPNPLAFQQRVDVGNLRVSDGLTEFAKVIRAANGGVGAVQVVLNALEGSSALDMIDNWSRTSGGITLDTEDLLAFSGNDVTIDLWQWFTTHQGEGANFGTNILDAVYNSTGPNATANKLPDIRAASAKIVISPATRQGPVTAGPLDADPNQTIGEIRPAMWAWAAANSATIGPEITDMRLAANEGPHQDPTSVRGNVRIGIRMGEAVNRALGLSDSVDPTIGTPVFASGKASFSLTVTLPNAGSTLRVDNAATYGSDVQGFEISTDGGSTWTRSGFTATFSGTTVTVTKDAGDWSAVTAGNMRVRYATGAPFGFGTSVESSELFRGGLYDGTALEGGLGLPVRPMASTVVAEP